MNVVVYSAVPDRSQNQTMQTLPLSAGTGDDCPMISDQPDRLLSNPVLAGAYGLHTRMMFAVVAMPFPAASSRFSHWTARLSFPPSANPHVPPFAPVSGGV